MHYPNEEPRAQAHERVSGRMRTINDPDGRQSLLAVLLAVAIFIGTGAFGFWQTTTPSRVQDQLELGIAELTDIDRYLATYLPDARAEATQSNATAVHLPGYPLPVTLTRTELLQTEDAELRELILERSASQVYVQGLDAFDRNGFQDLGFLTSEWWLDRQIDFLTGSWHARAGVLAVLGFLVAAVAATLIFARRPAADGLRSVGFSVLAGAVPGLVFMAAAAYWFGRSGGGDEFVRAISAIFESLFIVQRRVYLVVATVGAFFVAVGYLLPLISRFVPDRPSGSAMPIAGAGPYEIGEPEQAPETISERGSRGTSR